MPFRNYGSGFKIQSEQSKCSQSEDFLSNGGLARLGLPYTNVLEIRVELPAICPPFDRPILSFTSGGILLGLK